MTQKTLTSATSTATGFSTASTTNSSVTLIDARGPRFGAAITSIILATALLTHSALVIALSLLFFAIGSLRGPQFTPQGLFFKKFIKPRLSGETPTEDVRPPRFAQQVGLAFTVVALTAGLASWSAIFTVAVSLCLAAALLNAVFNFCLGCEIYLLVARLRARG
jgi:hypothetical protein